MSGRQAGLREARASGPLSPSRGGQGSGGQQRAAWTEDAPCERCGHVAPLAGPAGHPEPASGSRLLSSQLLLHPASCSRGLSPHPRPRGTEGRGDWMQGPPPDSPQEGWCQNSEASTQLPEPLQLPTAATAGPWLGVRASAVLSVRWVLSASPQGWPWGTWLSWSREGAGTGTARGKCSRAVAKLVQDVCEDFLLHRQGSGPSPHELQLLRTRREQGEAQGRRGCRLPSPDPT